MENSQDFLWAEKYRPKTIDDCILPESLKETFNKFIEKGNVPNLLLHGTSGIGKTTVAKAVLNQLSLDYMVINGSLDRNIDTLRNDIMQFASSVSFRGGRKYVILDEADYLNANSTQPALRNFMEQFSKNCGFILTCNYKNRIIENLHSRCAVIDFNINGKEKTKLAAKFMNRVISILEQEDIKYESKNVIAALISKHFPDLRRIINELQTYSVSGIIDSGILVNLAEDNIKSLVEYLKDKNFTSVRKWIAENSNVDVTTFFRSFYDNSFKYFKPQSIPALVLIIGKYQYQDAFVADHEINLVACMVEIMMECEFI